MIQSFFRYRKTLFTIPWGKNRVQNYLRGLTNEAEGHNHEPEPERLECLIAINKAKKLAIEIEHNPRAIISNVQTGVSCEGSESEEESSRSEEGSESEKTFNPYVASSNKFFRVTNTDKRFKVFTLY